MKGQYRQGDVLLERVKEVPAKAQQVDCTEEGRVILAHGEVTGHAHAISLTFATLFQTKAGARFVRLEEGAELTHEEHAVIAPAAGVYEVIIQREYTPEAIRNVRD